MIRRTVPRPRRRRQRQAPRRLQRAGALSGLGAARAPLLRRSVARCEYCPRQVLTRRVAAVPARDFPVAWGMLRMIFRNS